jgi:hypothetical protein
VLTLLTLLTAFGVAMQVATGTLPMNAVSVLTLVQLLLVVVPNMLLFLPRSRDWFAGAAAPRAEMGA